MKEIIINYKLAHKQNEANKVYGTNAEHTHIKI